MKAKRIRVHLSFDFSISFIHQVMIKNLGGGQNGQNGVITTEISDHMLIFISRKIINYRKNFSNKTLKFNDWRRFDKKGFDNSITGLLNEIKAIENIDNCVKYFNKNLIELYEKFVPKREIRIKDKSLPYLSKDIRLLIRERNKTKNRFNKVKRKNIINYELLEKYKSLRNRINIEMKRNKRKWFENQLEKDKTNLKKNVENYFTGYSNKKIEEIS